MESFALGVYDQASDFIYQRPACFVLGTMLLYQFMSWVLSKNFKKRFSAEDPTNIMITGGAQGLGKLLAEQFIRRSQIGSVNLIVVDIRGDLKAQLMKDIKALTNDPTFKQIHFYKANLADVEGTKQLWSKITRAHGPVHILVNNHAICQGKRLEEHSIERFKLTMEINFNSYVHLCMLFLSQNEIQDPRMGERFHLCNVNSIAGHLTCQRNSDYSASKFALTGFTDALR